MKSLGEAELEIMQVIWNSDSAVTSNYILKELEGKRRWSLSTLMTSLARLSAKEFVKCDRTSGTNMYSYIISESDYKASAGTGFLKSLYNNSICNMVASLYNDKKLSDEDIKELKNYLNELGDDKK